MSAPSSFRPGKFCEDRVRRFFREVRGWQHDPNWGNPDQRRPCDVIASYPLLPRYGIGLSVMVECKETRRPTLSRQVIEGPKTRHEHVQLSRHAQSGGVSLIVVCWVVDPERAASCRWFALTVQQWDLWFSSPVVPPETEVVWDPPETDKEWAGDHWVHLPDPEPTPVTDQVTPTTEDGGVPKSLPLADGKRPWWLQEVPFRALSEAHSGLVVEAVPDLRDVIEGAAERYDEAVPDLRAITGDVSVGGAA